MQRPQLTSLLSNENSNKKSAILTTVDHRSLLSLSFLERDLERDPERDRDREEERERLRRLLLRLLLLLLLLLRLEEEDREEDEDEEEERLLAPAASARRPSAHPCCMA